MVVSSKNLGALWRDTSTHLSYIGRTFRLIWSAAPAWTVAWALLLLLQGVVPAALVYLSKLLVDSLVAARAAGGAWIQLRHSLVIVVLTLGAMLLSEVLGSAIEWIRTAQSELVQDKIKYLVHEQSAAVDMAFYESADFYDQLDQVRGEASTRPLTLLENVGALLQNSLTLIAIAAILIPYGIWLPVALFVSTLPAFYVVFHFDRRYHQWWQHTTKDRRWAQYFDIMLTHKLAVGEMRLFGLGPHFQTSYQKLRARMRKERIEQVQKQATSKLGAGMLALVVAGGPMLWMGWRLLHGLATLGDLALFYQAFSRGQDLVRTLLDSLGKIYVNTLFLGNLFRFLDLKPEITDPLVPNRVPVRLEKGLEFREVTFRYPGSHRDALKNFNLLIPAGKIVAIVGPNGAGKTTLLKLLCRFYDPQEGRIELEGKNIRTFAVKDLWRQFTVLFQLPLNYQASVRESIAMSDLDAVPTLIEIEEAARKAGAHDFITRLPNGYNTLLGKTFEAGAELSGGEWQRIAMSRAYLRQSPIMLLDEPTSFLDSWSEVDWFDHFRTLARGRTAVIITHRFTIARRADIIHVMDKGEIVESGSHDELVASDGSYAQSWNAQVQARIHEDISEPALTF